MDCIPRLSLATVICFLIVPFVQAQVSPANQSRIALGIKGNTQLVGIANQNNYGQNEMDYQLTLGVGGGVALLYHRRPTDAIQFEVSYQTWGQKYLDRFKGREFKKELRYNMLSVPLAYRKILTETGTGYGGVGSELKPLWYLLGGLQFDKIFKPEATWYLDGQETNFLSFVLEGGNPNQAEIEAMGAPASDEDLFKSWDLLLIAGFGFKANVNPLFAFTVEARGGIGLTDLNAKSWQLENHRGVYGASRNMFIGLHAGANFLLTSEQ